MANRVHYRERHPDDAVRCMYCRRIELAGSGIESMKSDFNYEIGDRLYHGWFCSQTCLCMASYENGTASAMMNDHQFYLECLKRFYPNKFAKKFGYDVKGNKQQQEYIVGESGDHNGSDVEINE